jgi:hypothetical protein
VELLLLFFPFNINNIIEKVLMKRNLTLALLCPVFGICSIVVQGADDMDTRVWWDVADNN